MPVYVDKEANAYGRMKMCHMVADTESELHAMADRIGVERRWVQRSRCGVVHYDICKAKRRLAMAAGAMEVGREHMADLQRQARAAAMFCAHAAEARMADEHDSMPNMDDGRAPTC